VKIACGKKDKEEKIQSNLIIIIIVLLLLNIILKLSPYKKIMSNIFLDD
jgi:hypothetical protein